MPVSEVLLAQQYPCRQAGMVDVLICWWAVLGWTTSLTCTDLIHASWPPCNSSAHVANAAPEGDRWRQQQAGYTRLGAVKVLT